MNTANSFTATIWLGCVFIAGLVAAAIASGDRLQIGLALLVAAMSYVTQWLVTSGLLFVDRAYGPEVTSDDDPNHGKLLAHAKLSATLSRWMWIATVIVAAVAIARAVL